MSLWVRAIFMGGVILSLTHPQAVYGAKRPPYVSPCEQASALFIQSSSKPVFVPDAEHLELLSRGLGRAVSAKSLIKDLGLGDPRSTENAFTATYKKHFSISWQSVFVIESGGKTTWKQKNTFETQERNLSLLLNDLNLQRKFVSDWIGLFVESERYLHESDRTAARLLINSINSESKNSLVNNYYVNIIRSALEAHLKISQNKEIKKLKIQPSTKVGMISPVERMLLWGAVVAAGVGAANFILNWTNIFLKHSPAFIPFLKEPVTSVPSEIAIPLIALSIAAFYKMPTWKAWDRMRTAARSEPDLFKVADVVGAGGGQAMRGKEKVDFFISSKRKNLGEADPSLATDVLPIYLWWNGEILFNTDGADVTAELGESRSTPHLVLARAPYTKWLSEFNAEDFLTQALLSGREIPDSLVEPFPAKAFLTDASIANLKRIVEGTANQQKLQPISSSVVFLGVKEWSEIIYIKTRLEKILNLVTTKPLLGEKLDQLDQWKEKLTHFRLLEHRPLLDLLRFLEEGQVILGDYASLISELSDAMDRIRNDLVHLESINRDIQSQLVSFQNDYTKATDSLEELRTLEASIDRYEFILRLTQSDRVKNLPRFFREVETKLNKLLSENYAELEDVKAIDLIVAIGALKNQLSANPSQEEIDVELKRILDLVSLYRRRVLRGEL